MLNFISSLIGVIALIIAIIGFFPLLGWLNWIALPISVVGVIIGIVAIKNDGRNINLVVIVIAIFRLMIGGGIF